MNAKVWLTTYGVISALLIGAAGFFAFSSYGKYAEADSGWAKLVRTIEALEKKVPYPNEENVEALEAKVAEYEASVEELYQSLNTFQRPLNTTLPNTEFLQLVKKRVEEFRSFARSGGMEIQSTESSFELGFDAYSSLLPPPELVPVLDYELEAIDHLLRTLVTAGATKLNTFERDGIPGEAGVAESFENSAVHKYPVRMRFTAGYSAFQDFINSISNDKNFFYIVRVLKVKNQQIEGPPKLTGGAAGIPRYVNPNTQQMATPVMLQEWGYPEVPGEELESRANAAGFVLSETDARVLMGQEMLNVFMVVDIVRILSPQEVEAAKAANEESNSDRRRR